MDKQNNLPSTINGDGRKFISLLKGYLNDIKASLEDQINEVTKIWNGIADNPDTISEQVRNITINERSVNGSVSLILQWDSTPIKQYAGVSIDVKVGDFHDTVDQFADKQVHQHYDTGKTNIFTIPNVEIGKKYEFTIRGRDIRNALSESSKAPITYYYVSEQTHVPEPPYEATVVFDKRGVYWSWKQQPQNDYQWTELRLDEHVGELHNRLDLTTDWHSTAKPYARVGVGYLYNKGIGNSYSVPVTVSYNKAVPSAPQHVVVEKFYEGLTISFDAIPDDCNGAIVYINNEAHHITSNAFMFNCSTGEYTIKVCYTDIFGEGEMSQSVTTSTVEEIPPNAVHITNKTVFDDGIIVAKYIGDRAVVGTKIADSAITTDKLVADAVTGDKIAGNTITGDKIKAGSVTATHIATDAVTADKIKAGSVTGDKVVANAITGDKIAGNSISSDKIQTNAVDASKIKAGSVDASKMSVGRLDAITGNVGDLNGGSITGGTFKNANGSFKIDPTGNIIGANITGSKISADSIYQAGFHLKNLDVRTYKVKHGEWCPIPEGFTEAQCVFVPVGFVQTEIYKSSQHSNDGFKIEGRNKSRISREEMRKQKNRFQGSCDLYMVQDKNFGTTVGLKQVRQAVVESHSLKTYTSGGDNGNDWSEDIFTYGELFVLVIAKK